MRGSAAESPVLVSVLPAVFKLHPGSKATQVHQPHHQRAILRDHHAVRKQFILDVLKPVIGFNLYKPSVDAIGCSEDGSN